MKLIEFQIEEIKVKYNTKNAFTVSRPRSSIRSGLFISFSCVAELEQELVESLHMSLDSFFAGTR